MNIGARGAFARKPSLSPSSSRQPRWARRVLNRWCPAFDQRSNVISKIPMLKADIHRLSPVDLPPTLPTDAKATLLFRGDSWTHL